MMTPTQLAACLPQNAKARRADLIDAMTRLELSGVHCGACSGVCCTFVANSMMTTPLETAELLVYLVAEGRWHGETIARLQDTVRRYRLDQPAPGDGRRAFSRRTYTCPFFGEQALGCSLSRSIKPYGCLGFNARRAGLREGGDCGSDTALLKARDARFAAEEAAADRHLRTALGLEWDKLPMPWALLVLAERLDMGAADAPAAPPSKL